MAKCCCQGAIDASKNQILAALNKPLPVIPQAIPPFQRTQQDTEEIARRVADEVNRTEDPFQRDVQRQLDAIVNSLIALRSQQQNNELLLRIIRNQNDQFDLTREYQRQNQFNFDKLATREQAKDLLNAIALLRRDMLEQFRFSAREIANRFVAIGGAILALGVAQRAAFLAEIAAKTAQTATILAAIRALRLNPPPASGLPDILSALTNLIDNQLSLEPVTTSIPVCVNVPGIGASIQAQPVESYAITNGFGASTAVYQQSVSDMIFDLLKSGQLNCGGSISLSEEVIGQVSQDEVGADSPKVFFCEEVSPLYFVIAVTEVNPRFIRTYKIAGSESEYGLGNWSIVDSSSRVVGEFIRLFHRSQRLLIPSELSTPGVRVSVKSGISYTVTAYGYSNR